MAKAAARESLILKLMNGFPGSHSGITAGVIDAYVEATMDCSLEAIQRSVEQYRSGRVEEHHGNYAPSSADFAKNCRMWMSALAVLAGAGTGPKLITYPIGAEPPPPSVPLGPSKIDFGDGMIDMTTMSPAEKADALLQSILASVRDITVALRAAHPETVKESLKGLARADDLLSDTFQEIEDQNTL